MLESEIEIPPFYLIGLASYSILPGSRSLDGKDGRIGRATLAGLIHARASVRSFSRSILRFQVEICGTTYGKSLRE